MRVAEFRLEDMTAETLSIFPVPKVLASDTAGIREHLKLVGAFRSAELLLLWSSAPQKSMSPPCGG